MNDASPLIINQEKEGYRFSTEPFLLADFVPLKPEINILDIGTGCGVIPLLLTAREPSLKITAVEIQKPLYDSATQNVANNGLSQKIHVRHGDFLTLAATFKGFDLIVSNPPYRKVNCGRLNPNTIKAIARHELTLTLHTLVGKSAPMLKRGGRIALVHHPSRLEEVLRELRRHQLHPRRLRLIHGHRGAEAKIFLVEAVKEKFAKLVQEDPFYIYHADGSYTQEMKKVYASFNYPCRPHRFREERSRACVG